MPQPGEVWIADIPFTGGAASKLRPVLVLWTDAVVVRRGHFISPAFPVVIAKMTAVERPLHEYRSMLLTSV
jgi:hypothetical protein